MVTADSHAFFSGFYYNSRKKDANILRHAKADDLAFAVAIIFCWMKVATVNSLNIKSQFGASDIFNTVLSDTVFRRYDSFQPIIQCISLFCRQNR